MTWSSFSASGWLDYSRRLVFFKHPALNIYEYQSGVLGAALISAESEKTANAVLYSYNIENIILVFEQILADRRGGLKSI